MSTIIFGLREVYHNENTMWIMWSEEGEGRDCMGSMMFSGLHKFFPLWQHYMCVWRRKWVTCMSSNKMFSDMMFSGLSEVYHHNEDTIICFMGLKGWWFSGLGVVVHHGDKIPRYSALHT